mgnify:CR=1 FL=1
MFGAQEACDRAPTSNNSLQPPATMLTLAGCNYGHTT